MRNAALVGLLLAGLGAAQARPVIIEETAVLTPPPGVTYVAFGGQVGTNGEYALTVGSHPQPQGGLFAQTFDALLYRRVNGNWVFQQVLAQGSRSDDDWSYFPVIIGMKGNLASVTLGEMPGSIYRFDGANWVHTGNGAGLQEDVSIDGERVLYGVGESWNGRVFEPNGTGGWTSTFLPGQPRCCDDEHWGGPVDLLGERAILGTPETYDLEPQEIPIYQRSTSGWQLRTKLQVPAGEFRLGGEVALHGENALVDARSGPYIWNSSNSFTVPTGRLQAANSYARGASTYSFAKDGNLLLASGFDPDLGLTVINVFRPDAAGRYQHVAILKPRGSTSINGNLEIDGNTVVAGSNMRALVFTLPASVTAPAPRYDRFEGGNGGNWTPSAGSQFTVVRPTRINGVYRQTSTLGEAYALFSNTHAINQAMETDVRPLTFDGNDRWVGLATRFADPQNYYYVTLRSSGSLQLKRKRNGAFTTLASTPLVVQTNRTYRVRLESLGTLHRVFVNGALLLTAEDTGAQVPGSAAVIMYRAAADFDNVIVSPSSRSTIYADDFTGTTMRGDWSYNGAGQWGIASDTLAQSSVAAEARALIGAPATTDQIVSARIRPVAFASSPDGQERWIGLIARYSDERNYYYATLRNGNTLSLRKLVNGAITVLATVPVNVTTSSWYSLRLEVLASTLRVYLGDALVMQVVDTAHMRGRTGLMTYKAAAQFDDYASYRP
jgi:hypothetical protein